MGTEFTYERHPETGEILTAYLKLSDQDSVKTTEVVYGKCLVDEAADGSVVGIEFIQPNKIADSLKVVVDRYDDPAVSTAVQELSRLWRDLTVSA